MPRILFSVLLLLSITSLAGGQDFTDLWNSIANGGENVGNSVVDIAKSTWNLLKNGGNTVGTGASNFTQAVGNFFRGNGFRTNADYDQQRNGQSSQYFSQGYYGDSPYKYNGYDIQNPTYENEYNYGQRGQQQFGNDPNYQNNGYESMYDANNSPNRGRKHS